MFWDVVVCFVSIGDLLLVEGKISLKSVLLVKWLHFAGDVCSSCLNNFVESIFSFDSKACLDVTIHFINLLQYNTNSENNVLLVVQWHAQLSVEFKICVRGWFYRSIITSAFHESRADFPFQVSQCLLKNIRSSCCPFVFTCLWVRSDRPTPRFRRGDYLLNASGA